MMSFETKPWARVVSIIGLIVGATGLGLFLLAIPARLAVGGSLLGAIIFYFSFFTILTNIGVFLTHLSHIRPNAPLGWFRRPEIRGMFAALIFLVMLVYHLVLAKIWNPQGPLKIADIALHYLAPIVFIGWWFFFQPHRRLAFRNIPAMLVPPVLYNLYAMTRGAITGEYPYPFLDTGKLGYTVVGGNILALLLFVIGLFGLVIVVDRRLRA
jgi:hypothetical protein